MAAKDIVLFIMVLILICAFVWQIISDEKKKDEIKKKNEKARQELIDREARDINLDSEQ